MQSVAHKSPQCLEHGIQKFFRIIFTQVFFCCAQPFLSHLVCSSAFKKGDISLNGFISLSENKEEYKQQCWRSTQCVEQRSAIQCSVSLNECRRIDLDKADVLANKLHV